MSANKKNVIIIGVEIDPERSYRIEDVSLMTGYTTGYIRNLERAKKIPTANRDIKGWRTWIGSEVALIVEYCRQHHALGSKNLISNKPKNEDKSSREENTSSEEKKYSDEQLTESEIKLRLGRCPVEKQTYYLALLEEIRIDKEKEAL